MSLLAKVPVLGQAAFVAALAGDIVKAGEDIDLTGKISDGTMCSLAADVTAGLGLLAAAGVAAGTVSAATAAAACVAGALLTTAAILQPDKADTSVSDAAIDLAKAIQDAVKEFSDGFDDFIDQLEHEVVDTMDAIKDQLGGAAGAIEDAVNALIDPFDKFFDMLGHRAVDAIDAIKSLFGAAEKQSSPLILDLDGDGVETTGVKAGTYFDQGGDGFAEQTGWVGKDDGLLVLDRNNNGLIDSGMELFGDSTLLANGQKAANGFAALSELDQNHDGLIDAQDAAFADLRVWKDADGDGISQAGELLTLTEAGVRSIATASTVSTLVDANGNADKQIGSFTKTDGSTAAVDDIWFTVDRTHSIATEWLDFPDDIAALPDAKGYGQVYDLQ